MDGENPVRLHLMNTAQHMRMLTMGLILLLVMRFNPGGILPETVNRVERPQNKIDE
jgi:branched-chain amino acid transport system permease protein